MDADVLIGSVTAGAVARAHLQGRPGHERLIRECGRTEGGARLAIGRGAQGKDALHERMLDTDARGVETERADVDVALHMSADGVVDGFVAVTFIGPYRQGIRSQLLLQAIGRVPYG